jgi:hypothetical protein
MMRLACKGTRINIATLMTFQFQLVARQDWPTEKFGGTKHQVGEAERI